VQRLAQVVEYVRRWLAEALSSGQRTEAVAEKVRQAEAVKKTESVKPEEKMVETVKPLTVGEALQQKRVARRKSDRGIKPPGDTGHSHGIGI
jgi:uncharacterized protein YoaH (UPF0181 family)